MMAIMKREIRNYLKRPLFWLGVVIVVLGVYVHLDPYLKIHYIRSEEELLENFPAEDFPDQVHEGEVYEGYIPCSEEEQRALWENNIRKDLISAFSMSEKEADTVIEVLQGLELKEACEYLEREYHYYGAMSGYRDFSYRRGTKDEINAYIEEKLQQKSFSYYFSRKFADFAGLYMGFFATIMLSVLYIQDTRRAAYELLHTKSVSRAGYILGKTAGGFLVCLITLGILNLLFFAACLICTGGRGFEIKLVDFIGATCLYILPNMLMIVCIYGLISILFKNPLPGVPLLILYIVYSNMGRRNADGLFGYYGRPLAIMVRFPGQFFDTAPPPMVIMNQTFLIFASAGILLLTLWLWRRRRM